METMHCVIAGYGRVGRHLASTLESQGHSVAIIDRDPHVFEDPDGIRGRKLIGQVFDRRVLKKAGIEQASCFAAVTSGDNSNMVSARVAKERFHVPIVVARIYEPRRAKLYRELGIDTLSTVEWAAERLLGMISHPGVRTDYMFCAEAELVDVAVPHEKVGESPFGYEVVGQVRVAAVCRDGKALIPGPDFLLEENDHLSLVVARESFGKVCDMFRLS